jgi:hypothetical protein
MPPPRSVADLLSFAYECLEAGTQGVVVEPQRESVLAGMNALVHQGVSVAEALAIAEPERIPVTD